MSAVVTTTTTSDEAEKAFKRNLRDLDDDDSKAEYEARVAHYRAHSKWRMLSPAAQVELVDQWCGSSSVTAFLRNRTYAELTTDVDEAFEADQLKKAKAMYEKQATQSPQPEATPLVPYSPPPISAAAATKLSGDAIVGGQVAVSKNALDVAMGAIVLPLEALKHVERPSGLSNTLVETAGQYKNRVAFQDAKKSGTLKTDDGPTSGVDFTAAVASSSSSSSAAPSPPSTAVATAPQNRASHVASQVSATPPLAAVSTMDTKHAATKRPGSTDPMGDRAAKKQRTSGEDGSSSPLPPPPMSPPPQQVIPKKKAAAAATATPAPPLMAITPRVTAAAASVGVTNPIASPTRNGSGIKSNGSTKGRESPSPRRSGSSSSDHKEPPAAAAAAAAVNGFSGFRPVVIDPPKLGAAALQGVPVTAQSALVAFEAKIRQSFASMISASGEEGARVYRDHRSFMLRELAKLEAEIRLLRSDFGVWHGRLNSSNNSNQHVDIADIVRRLDAHSTLLNSLQTDVGHLKADLFVMKTVAASSSRLPALPPPPTGSASSSSSIPQPVPLKILTAKEHLPMFRVAPPSRRDMRLVEKILKMARESQCKRIAVDFDAVVASSAGFPWSQAWRGTHPAPVLKDKPSMCTACLPWLAELQIQLARMDQTLYFFTTREYSNGAASQDFIDYYFLHAMNDHYDPAARLKICNTIFNVKIVDGKTKQAHPVLNNIVDVGAARTVDMYRSKPEVVAKIPEHAREFASIHSRAKREAAMKSTEALWRTVVDAIKVRADIEDGVNRHTDADDDVLGSSSGSGGDGFQVFFLFGADSSIVSIPDPAGGNEDGEDTYEDLPWQLAKRHLVVDHSFGSYDPRCIPVEGKTSEDDKDEDDEEEEETAAKEGGGGDGSSDDDDADMDGLYAALEMVRANTPVDASEVVAAAWPKVAASLAKQDAAESARPN